MDVIAITINTTGIIQIKNQTRKKTKKIVSIMEVAIVAAVDHHRLLLPRKNITSITIDTIGMPLMR